MEIQEENYNTSSFTMTRFFLVAIVVGITSFLLWNFYNTYLTRSKAAEGSSIKITIPKVLSAIQVGATTKVNLTLESVDKDAFVNGFHVTIKSEGPQGKESPLTIEKVDRPIYTDAAGVKKTVDFSEVFTSPSSDKTSVSIAYVSMEKVDNLPTKVEIPVTLKRSSNDEGKLVVGTKDIAYSKSNGVSAVYSIDSSSILAADLKAIAGGTTVADNGGAQTAEPPVVSPEVSPEVSPQQKPADPAEKPKDTVPSPTTSFITLAPEIPTQSDSICPAPGTKVTITWDKVEGALWYALRIDDDANGYSENCGKQNSGDFCSNKMVKNSLTFTTKPGHTYNWWYHVKTAKGWSTAIGGKQFKCDAP